MARKSSEDMNDNLGPLIPRLNLTSPAAFANPLPTVPSSASEKSSISTDALGALTKNPSQDLFMDSQNTKSSEPDEDNLAELCSGQFLTEAPHTPEETQVDGFNEDEELLDVDEEEPEKEMCTPKANPIDPGTIIEDGLGETPKLLEKAPTVRLLDFRKNRTGSEKIGPKTRLLFDENSNDKELSKPIEDSEDDDDNESVIGFRSLKKKKRQRIQMSGKKTQCAFHAVESISVLATILRILIGFQMTKMKLS